jgi:hypothetical protein
MLSKLLLINFLIFTSVNALHAQSAIVNQLTEIELGYEQTLPRFISSTKNSDAYRVKVEEWVEILDKYLDKNSGLSFDEMNQVRAIRKRAKTIAEFSWMGQAERNCGWAPIDIINRIQEIYPEISIQKEKTESPCVDVLRFHLGKYIFFTASHKENDFIKRVYYKTKFSEYSIKEGYCGAQPYKLTKICDNANQLSSQNFVPIIIKCENLENVLKKY